MRISSDIRGGISTIAALLTLLSLVAMGAVIAYLVAAGEESRANHVSSMKAFYVTQAGIEYAVKKIYEGDSEIVNPPGKIFGEGSFTVSRSGRTLTVNGTVGNAVRVHRVDSPTMADCTILDTSDADLAGDNKEIKQTYFRKICLTQVVIDKMQFSWVPDNGERINEIKISDLKIYDNPAGAPSGTLLDVVDYVLTTGNNNVINHIKFIQSLTPGLTVNMTFFYGDGTDETDTFQPD